MTGQTQTHVATLDAIECAKCGVTYAATEKFIAARRADHREFYCVNGHSQYFPQKNEAEALRARLRAAEAQLTSTRDQLEATERQRRAQKGQVTRLRNRIAAGVCPCCNRSFQDVRSHMKGEHPDFAIPSEGVAS